MPPAVAIGVRDVIRNLNYDELVGSGIIPPGVFSSKEIPKRKFPTIVYKTPDGFVKFGHFLEGYMRSVITCEGDDRMLLYKGLLEDPSYVELFTSIRNYIKKEYSSSMCKFDVELLGTNFAGHPDIVIRKNAESIMVDVKTTSNFEGMRKETELQLLAYAALARENGRIVKEIRVALPWNRTSISYSVAKWDHRPFLSKLEEAATHNDSALPAPIVEALAHSIGSAIISELAHDDTVTTHATENAADYLEFRDAIENVGCHTHRLSTLYETVSTFYSKWSRRAACQFFLVGNQGAKEKTFSDDDIVQTYMFIQKYSARVYVHAPYSINLSLPRNKKSEERRETGSWSLNLLRKQIETTTAFGGRGVVVHVGKPKTEITPEAGKIEMINSVKSLLGACSPECQLLIETPAGQGTELYTQPDELWEFWESFSASEKSRMGICIDTCHVFAAGHDPIHYLEYWLKRDSAAISLIHLNDSKHECGSRKDRHAIPGQGRIGIEILNKIVAMVGPYGVPLVME
jgi:deoxyribonuclease-4